MNHHPLVSVIIPVYNGEAYLAEAIESVLRQTYRPIELIVVDDGSTDRSAEVAKRFLEVRYCFQPQSGGAAAARNRGTQLAQGAFLAFLDADDLWVENKLALQVAVFENDPELEAVFAHLEQFISPELHENLKAKIHCPTEIQPGIHPGAMLIKRKAFARIGPFNTKFKLAEIVEWNVRAKEKELKSLLLPDMLYRRRLHTTNQGILKRRYQTEYLHILKAALERKRQKKAIIQEEKDRCQP